MNTAAKSLQRLVVILEPTASGKSSLGIWLAERLGGEVVACDSTQVYRQFTIGTGKTSAEDQRGIPHHLMDVAEPEEIFTAGEYRRRTLETLAGIWKRGNLPILTAGTGLYLRALLEGLSDAPQRCEELRERLRRDAAERGPGYLHRMLQKLDRQAAARIESADVQKVIRAVEICLLSGKAATEILKSARQGLEGVETRKIGLLPSRDELYARINQRVLQMMEDGWVEEVRSILASGIPPSTKPFTFIGYSQLLEHIRGERKLDEAVEKIQILTRNYAKRQITWFRRESGVRWLAGFGDSTEIRKQALRAIEEP